MNKVKDLYEESKKVKRDIEVANNVHKRIISKVLNKEDSKSRSRNYKRVKRKSLLDNLVPGRICPVCLSTKSRSRSWVIYTQNDKVQAVCKSCFLKSKRM